MDAAISGGGGATATPREGMRAMREPLDSGANLRGADDSREATIIIDPREMHGRGWSSPDSQCTAWLSDGSACELAEVESKSKAELQSALGAAADAEERDVLHLLGLAGESAAPEEDQLEEEGGGGGEGGAESVLMKRNRELEEETELLRLRAELIREELRELRGAGVEDADIKDRLLGVEIKRHKSFVERMLAEAERPSLATMPLEDRFRLVQSGLESCKFHLLGVVFAAGVDPAWTTSPTKFPAIKGAGGVVRHETTAKFEYRPAGVPRESATCLNVLFEWALTTNCEAYFRERTFPRLGELKTGYGTTQVTVDVTPTGFEEIAAEMGEDSAIRIFHEYEVASDEPDRRLGECYYAVMKASVDVSLEAVFPEHSRRAGLPSGTTARALLRCVSVVSGPGAAGDAGAASGSHQVHGLLACSDPNDPEGSSWFMNINAYPGSERVFGKRIAEAFNADGALHPDAHAKLLNESHEALNALQPPPRRKATSPP